MLTVNELFDKLPIRVCGGSEYQWQCYGANAHFLNSLDHAGDDRMSIVYDTQTQQVYEVVVQYTNDKIYRWIDGEFKQRLIDESITRGGDHFVAYDGVRYTDLETTRDLMQKADAILHGQQPDERIEIELDLDDDTLFGIMKMAHERDITLNAMVEQIVQLAIDERRYLDAQHC
jgi:hypothetical protein